MNLALMALGSFLQGGATPAATQGRATPGAANNDLIASNGTPGLSRLLTDLQSLLSTFGGTSSSASTAGAAGSSASETAPPASNNGTRIGTPSPDLQQLPVELGGLASAFGTTHRGEHGDHVRPEPPPGPPPGSSDILNSGTVSASAGSGITGNRTATAGNGWQTFMQQFAAGAYRSGYDSSTTSALMAINA